MRTILTPSAEHLDLDAATLERHPDNDTRRFPDGEVYVRLSEAADLAEVRVVHAGMPEPDKGLSYLTGLLELLREHSVTTEVCFTYMPYGMQDEAFHDGSLNQARSLFRLLTEYYGVEELYTVDAHFGHRSWPGSFPFTDLHAFPLLAEATGMEDFVVIGPDLGAQQRFGIESFSKRRDSAHDVDISGDVTDVEGRNVLVFDDIIETGGTLEEAYAELEERGAERIEAAAVHGVLAEGIERVGSTYDELYLTNTVQHDREAVGIEPLLRDLD